MRTCQKVTYFTEEAARVWCAKTYIDLERRGAESPERLALLTHYRCDPCNGWHVGHRTPRDEKPAGAGA